ncbi:MAG: alcohol dehydrogenase catalytic domain-containing protein [Solirubrobacterales bacterium]
MRTLTYLRPRVLEWQDSPDPVLEEDRDALVRPLAATVCDLDQFVIRGEAPFQGPFAIGHECLAEVVDLGDAVSRLKPGDRVIVPWHIACGECGRCRSGLTAHCEEVPYGAMFGLPVAGDWGGLFSDLVRVPFADAMLVPVPEGIELGAVASAGDNLTLAYECVASHLRDRPGASVLVLGAGSVGLYAVQLAAALGAARLVYVDRDGARREFAGSLGAEAIDEPPSHNAGAFDLAVDAAMNEHWLHRSLKLLEPEGVCECPSIYLKDVALPAFQMGIRGVRFHTGRGNALPNISPVLELVVAGRIQPERVVSQSLQWETAPEALADPSLKPVFIRDIG